MNRFPDFLGHTLVRLNRDDLPPDLLALELALGLRNAFTAAIRREMKRRAAVEPVIGHLKAEHRMGRNYFKGPEGDRMNAVLAAAGYNFKLLLR